jgi:hypothetical protein
MIDFEAPLQGGRANFAQANLGRRREMTRMLAFVAALLLTAITVSSACVASSASPLQFTIEPAHQAGEVKVRFERHRSGHSENNWESSFKPSELAGLDLATLNSAGTRPVRFAIVREAGRVDCAGTGGNAMARGDCTLTPDEQFNHFLRQHGIAQPTEDQTFGLVALNVHRDLVQALSQAHYPTPTVENLIELTAVDVTPGYISALAGHGYRPESLDGLVEFAALKITPDYIGSFVSAGYGNLRPDDLVQLKALDITPEFIAGFERIGYRHLPVDTLVQLKAMDVTPEFVRAVRQGDTLPPPDRLVQLRALGRESRQH